MRAVSAWLVLVFFGWVVHPVLAVAVANLPPTIEGKPTLSVVSNSAYSFAPVASDPEGAKLTFSITKKPAWAVFNTSTGVLSGTPSGKQAAVYSGIVISVSDGKLRASLPPFNITVNNPAPVIGGTPAATVIANSAYSFLPTVTDPNGDALVFSIAKKPTWATFNITTGALTGTPPSARAGSYAGIIISVFDGKNRVSLPPFTITVSNPAPTLNGVPTTYALVDNTYNFKPEAQDPNGDVLKFSITKKPTWAAFDTKTGALTGKPSKKYLGTTKGVVISVSDGKTKVSLSPFDLEVRLTSPNLAPTIGGIVVTTGSVGELYSFTPNASDADGDTLTFSIINKPEWASFDAATGALRGTPTQVETIDNITISVNDGKGGSANLGPFSITVAASRLEQAITTGDASAVTDVELLDAALVQSQADLNTCKTNLASIYPAGVQQVNFLNRSAYMASGSLRNFPLHAAYNGGDIKVYSWIGSKTDGTRYAVLGTNVFTNDTSNYGSANTTVHESTLNTIRWLLGRSTNTDVLNESLTLFVPDYWDRQALNNWFAANGLTHHWTISGDTNLLTTGAFDFYLADLGRPLTEKQQVLNLKKPLLVFNNWYEPRAADLALFDLVWRWYGGASIGDFASVDALCSQAASLPVIHTLLTNLHDGMPDFLYNASNCPNETGTIKCDLLKVTTDGVEQSVEARFNRGATAIRTALQLLDKVDTNLFSQGNDQRLLKLLVLLGDKYRADITYPMDKATTNDTTFYRALFADFAVHYARSNNSYQPDMGDFTDAQVALNTALTKTATRTFTPTEFDEWSSTGLYAPPGKTITVRRTDAGSNTVKLKFNYLRESTRLWNTNKYSRPRYMTSPEITLEAGKTYTFSTPYGGPVYLGWVAVASGATPFTVEFSNVQDNLLLTAFDDASIESFLGNVLLADSDWVDIKTPYAEVHTLKANMLTAFAKQDGNSSNGYTIQDVKAYIDDLNNYLIAGNYNYAGFTGVGLPALVDDVQAFCNAIGLDSVVYAGTTKNLCTDAVINAKPKIQHINSDVNAACGALCAGNPFDSGSAIMPLDWGENHEMGHNLQRTRLKIYDKRSGEVSNNIFPLHTQWKWTVSQGLSKHPSQDRPSNQEAFTILQNAIAAGTAANASHPLWVGTGTYDYAFERLSFYLQLAYTQQSWDMYTKIYLMERILTNAVKVADQQDPDKNWNAVKNLLGMGNYNRTDASGVNGNDFMYLAASKIAGKDYGNFFAAWGVEVSATAKAQVAANGFAEQIPTVFYYVNDELPAAMPTAADAIPLNGTSSWVDPTP